MFRYLTLAGLALSAQLASAHEYWFEPEAYRLPSGATIVADAVNGENFGGPKMAYSARGYERSGIFAGDVEIAPLPGSQSQRPAVQVPAAADGLNLLWYRSSASIITYPTIEKFASFLNGKKLDAALTEHKAQGWPEKDIREAYFRYVKSLVAVGGSAGSDRVLGLPYEFVALDNPYEDDGPVRVQLLERSQPVPMTAIYVFHKSETKAAEKTWYQTDADGVFSLPRVPGEYLINAVSILPAPPRIQQDLNALWVTLWASLTFEL